MDRRDLLSHSVLAFSNTPTRSISSVLELGTDRRMSSLSPAAPSSIARLSPTNQSLPLLRRRLSCPSSCLLCRRGLFSSRYAEAPQRSLTNDRRPSSTLSAYRTVHPSQRAPSLCSCIIRGRRLSWTYSRSDSRWVLWAFRSGGVDWLVGRCIG